MSILTSLTQLTREQLLALDPSEIDWPLSVDEILHLATALGAYWIYDYEALAAGRPGYHAQLKSDACSDGFFNAKAVLAHSNLRRLIADQMVMKVEAVRPVLPKPGYIFGIPDAASELAKDAAELMDVPLVKLVKREGKIAVEGKVPAGMTGLGFEDICTRGTGWREAVSCLLDAEPETWILPHEIVLLNRGGLSVIEVRGKHYAINALVEKRMKEWDPPCELCARGSKRIKPKASEENWRLITTAQIAA